MAEQSTEKPSEVSEKYDAKQSEASWQTYWEQEGIYSFNPDSTAEIFSIDTPPPTVSGKMHLGHSFSYTQQDIIARYKRMKGFNVFYPFGTDDNGLATERLIEKMKNVKATRMPREDFIKLCLETLDKELRPGYIADWKRIGMSCDWSIFYTTIDAHSQKVSQKAFLDLVKQNRAYRKEAPVMWDTVLQTALSQVELVDEEKKSFFNDIIFKTEDGISITIATTRPELLCACVAVFVHPEDSRYKHLVGKNLIVPVYHFPVPVLTDERADPEKGTGIVMCCTYGDQTDIEWQKAHSLPIKQGITADGKMTSIAGAYSGMPIKEARTAIIEEMKKTGELTVQKPISHMVNVGERSGAEVEFLNTKQWFIKYLDLKEEFLARGKELNWFPEHMRNRYENWIKGLQWDWCISRQRFSGVPFPVWYHAQTKEPIYATEDQLPVDPIKDLPEGYSQDEVIPETDVMDTWATSSLTPQIAVDLFKNHPVYKRLLPMSLRPQAHDIITFWLFNTVVRSHLHHNQLPWKDVMISGWALDPHGKKMSKSKGNTVEPQGMIEKYSADALRFWAASSSLGDDLPFQEKDFVTGTKNVNKIWNATKFTAPHFVDFDPHAVFDKEKLEIMDTWLLIKLNKLVTTSTVAMDKYEYNRTKLDTEKFFWQVLCDNYLEIVKDRLYNPDRRGSEQRLSAQFALYTGMLTTLKLFAPIMPYITEEVYHKYFKKYENEKSVHILSWPVADESYYDTSIEVTGDLAITVIQEVRKAKSEAKKSLKEPVKELIVHGKIAPELFDRIRDDIVATTSTQKIFYKQLPKDSEKDTMCEIVL